MLLPCSTWSYNGHRSHLPSSIFLTLFLRIACCSSCSTWSYDDYPFLWEPTICLLTNVTYSQRINVPGALRQPAGLLGAVCRRCGGLARMQRPGAHGCCRLDVQEQDRMMRRWLPGHMRLCHSRLLPWALPADNFNWCFVPLSGSDAFLFVSLALIACGCLFGKLSAVWVLVAGARLYVLAADGRFVSYDVGNWLTGVHRWGGKHSACNLWHNSAPTSTPDVCHSYSAQAAWWAW